MSNEAPETEHEVMVALAGDADDPDRCYLQLSTLAPHVLAVLTTAREQGRAEALADVTEGEFRAAYRATHPPHHEQWLSLGQIFGYMETVDALLASRRRPVAAAGNEEWDRSG